VDRDLLLVEEIVLVSDLKVSGFGFRVSGLKVSGFGFEGFGSRVSGFGAQGLRFSHTISHKPRLYRQPYKSYT